MNQTNLNIMKALRIIFLLIIMVGCTKENSNYKSVGTIAGFDHTMCGCCGGWIIIIDDTTYLIDSMPEDSEINLATETFPITVKLDWKLVNNGCSAYNRITVQRIIKI
jgi:hypothetical protein